jgi:RNA polymerase sigma factor (sigma-70 family)
LRDRGAAEDAAQDAFAKAFRKWRAVSAMERPEAWVFVVAVRDARRRLARIERIERRAAQAVERRAVERRAVDAAVGDDMAALLRQLSPRQRTAVLLRYWGDLDEATMAVAMGCARGTVKATLSQAVAHLRLAVAREEVCDAY